MLVPAAGSGIPGAPADWEPEPGMEQHIPVLFLDLNGMYELLWFLVNFPRFVRVTCLVNSKPVMERHIPMLFFDLNGMYELPPSFGKFPQIQYVPF